MFGHSGLPRAISEGSLQSLQFLDRAAAMDDLTPDVCEEKGGAVRIRCWLCQRATGISSGCVVGQRTRVWESWILRCVVIRSWRWRQDGNSGSFGDPCWPPILGDVDVENKSNPASHALKQAVQEYHGTEPDWLVVACCMRVVACCNLLYLACCNLLCLDVTWRM